MDEQNLHVLSSTVNDLSTSYNDKIKALLLGWQSVSSNLSESSVGLPREMINFLHKYTLKYLLHGDWARLEASLKTKFTLVLHKVLMELSKTTNEEASKKCEFLIKLIHEPWNNSILHKILHSLSPTDDEVCEFISSEGCELILMRLELLCEEKCEDYALNLAVTILNHLSHCNKFKKSDIDHITDIWLILLFRFERNQEIIDKLKDLDLNEGLQLIRRFSQRKNKRNSIWKFCDQVNEIAAHTILASSMVQNFESKEQQKILYDLINEWAFIHVPKLNKCLSSLCNMVRKIIQKTESPVHIYIFAQVLHKKLGGQVKPLCIELYIKGFTSNINLIEQYKSSNDHEKILKAEILLSNSFVQLSEILCNNIFIYRECLLTAFSLYPTEKCLKKLEKAALFCCHCKNESSKLKDCKNISCIFNTKKADNQFNEAINGLNILNSEFLGLAPHLCDDLSTVLSNPRSLTLSWSQGWIVLKKLCENYMCSYYEGNKKIARNLELKYINIDYTKLKNEPFEENDFVKKNGISVKNGESLNQTNIIQRNNLKVSVQKICNNNLINKINNISFEENRQCKVYKKPLILQRNNSRKSNSSNHVRSDLQKIKNTNDFRPAHSGSDYNCNYTPYSSSNTARSPKPGEVPPEILIDSSYHDSSYQSKLSTPLAKSMNTQKVIMTDINNITAECNSSIYNHHEITELNRLNFSHHHRSNNKILTEFIPGMNSLDLIVPLRPEPTVQVVQIPSSNTILQPVSSNSSSAIQTNSTSIAVSKPLNESINTQSNEVVMSHSQTRSESIEHTVESTNNSNLLLSNSNALARNQNNDQRFTTSHISNNSAIPRTLQKPSSSDTTDTISVSSNSTNLGVNALSCSHEGSTQVTAHIQRIGQPPHKQRILYDDVLFPDTIQMFDESNKVVTSCPANPGSVSGSIYRLILKDEKYLEQFCPGNSNSMFPLPDILPENSAHNSAQQEDVIKLFKKIKDESANTENLQIPSLPQFHQVFRRQVYQGGSVIEGSSIPASPNQFSDDSSSEIQKQENSSPSSPLSKAVQTVLKDTNLKTKALNEKKNEEVPTNVLSIQSSIKASVGLDKKEHAKETDIQSTSGVIFSCKVPISLPNNSVLQNKPVSILKAPISHEASKNPQKIDPDNKCKDSVIRSNMNALLAAALQNNSIKPNISESTDPSGIHCVKQINKSGAQELKPDSSSIAASKIRMSSPNPKNSKRQTVGQQLSRFSRSPVHAPSKSPVSQSPPVSNPIPSRTVQVLTNISQSTLPNLPKIDNRREQNNEQSSVSSTTLEQLREFESVLEQVTNTSQMKERSNVKKTDSLTLVQTSEPEYSNVTTSKVNTLFQTNLVSAISDLNTDRVSLTFISKPSTTTSNTLITSSSSKIAGTTPVVVVQSCSRPLTSPALSLNSQSSPGSSPTTSPANAQTKISPKLSKPKAKSIGKTTPTATLKVSTLPKPQQKPQEDEQTTQRIYAILDKYAEQLRNSPELKNKPAPRRRSNPPTNPSQSSKRKKSSQGKSKSFSSIPSCSGLEMSPSSEDLRTGGSEDSSNGVNQVTQTINSPHSRSEEHSNPSGDIVSDKCESLDKDQRLQHRILLADQSSGSGRTVIVQDNLQPVLSVEGTKVIAGKQLVVGGGATVPLTLSLPGTGNVKQVLFPVPADGRPFVVAKVPKMYRFHQVTMPSGSPLIASASSGTVLLRQMCLNKSNSTLKQVKLPVVSQISSHMASQPAVVLPSGSQSFTLSASSSAIDGDIGIALDNTILLNSSTSGSSVGFLPRNLSKASQASNVISNNRPLTLQESSSVSSSNEVLLSVKTENLSSEHLNVENSNNQDVKNEDVKFCLNDDSEEDKSQISVPIIASTSTCSSWTQALKDANVGCNIINKSKEKEEKADDRKETADVLGCHRKESQSDRRNEDMCKNTIVENTTTKLNMPENSSYCLEGSSLTESKSIVQQQNLNDNWQFNIKLEKSCNSIKNESISGLNEPVKGTDSSHQISSGSTHTPSQGLKRKVENTIFQIAFKKDKIKFSKEDLIQQRSACALERELRLQKSLSEECEDLGVDKPSTSDLFPEAELLLDSDPLSRDSLQNEFLTRVDSSSSSLSSPNCSPVMTSKYSNSRKKTKKSILRHKFNCSTSISASKKVALSKINSSRETTCVNAKSGTSKSICYGIKNANSSKCTSKKRETISGHEHQGSSISMDCNDSDPCNFSDVDDDCNDTDVLDTEGDSDIDFLLKTQDSRHNVPQKGGTVEKIPEPTLMNRLSQSSSNKGDYYLNKVSLIDKRNVDPSPWYQVTNKLQSINKEAVDSEIDKNTNGTLKDGFSESINGIKEDLGDHSESINNFSSTSVFQNKKRKRIGLFLTSHSEEESVSSLDTVLVGSDSCSGFHDSICKNSTVREKMKKGCNCLNRSPETNKKKKELPITEKTDKQPCSTKHSFSYSTKKPLNKSSTVKIVNKKR